jgi:hypothetical protein
MHACCQVATATALTRKFRCVLYQYIMCDTRCMHLCISKIGYPTCSMPRRLHVCIAKGAEAISAGSFPLFPFRLLMNCCTYTYIDPCVNTPTCMQPQGAYLSIYLRQQRKLPISKRFQSPDDTLAKDVWG